MVPVTDNIGICAKHRATSLWFKDSSNTSLLMLYLSFIYISYKGLSCVGEKWAEKRASLLWSWSHAFVFRSLFLIPWMLSLIFPRVWSLMPTEQSRCSGSHTDGFLPKLSAEGLPAVAEVRVCSKACWKGVWAGMVGYKLKCRYTATSAESAASHWCDNFGWRSVTKQLKWAKGRKAKGSNTWNWHLLAPWTDSNSPRRGKAQILCLGALTGQGPLDHQRIFTVLSCCLLWCCCFASANPTLWPV